MPLFVRVIANTSILKQSLCYNFWQNTMHCKRTLIVKIFTYAIFYTPHSPIYVAISEENKLFMSFCYDI